MTGADRAAIAPGMKNLRTLVTILALALPSAAVAEPPAEAPAKLPDRVTIVKLISWAETAPKGCETDLEGSAPPASFTLRYEEEGSKPVLIETSTDDLFGNGWSIISRSERGYGFERAGAYTKLDFDVVEELRCSCGQGEKASKDSSLIRIAIDWKAGERPQVTGRLETGDVTANVEPVTINGRLAVYEFRFARPLPGGGEGECASRFFATLGLSEPIE